MTILSIQDTLLVWSQQEKAPAELAMNHIDRGRLEQTFIRARQIAAELNEGIAAVRARPHEDLSSAIIQFTALGLTGPFSAVA